MFFDIFATSLNFIVFALDVVFSFKGFLLHLLHLVLYMENVAFDGKLFKANTICVKFPCIFMKIIFDVLDRLPRL